MSAIEPIGVIHNPVTVTLTGNDYVDTFIYLLGSTAAVINVIGVVGVLFLKTQYKKALAKHQHGLELKSLEYAASLALKSAEHTSSLKAKYDKEVEALKSELARAAAKGQLLFSTVYQKREEILRDLYRKLCDGIDKCNETHVGGSAENVLLAQRQMRQLHIEMESVAIYFSESFCRTWHEHVDAVASSLGQMKHASENRTANLAEDQQLLRKTFNDYVAALKAVRTDLRKEIRSLIGIEDASASRPEI